MGPRVKRAGVKIMLTTVTNRKTVTRKTGDKSIDESKPEPFSV